MQHAKRRQDREHTYHVLRRNDRLVEKLSRITLSFFCHYPWVLRKPDHVALFRVYGVWWALLSSTALAYSITFMYINPATFNRASEGATDRLAQMLVSVLVLD